MNDNSISKGEGTNFKDLRYFNPALVPEKLYEVDPDQIILPDPPPFDVFDTSEIEEKLPSICACPPQHSHPYRPNTHHELHAHAPPSKEDVNQLEYDPVIEAYVEENPKRTTWRPKEFGYDPKVIQQSFEESEEMKDR
jgi:hypothetical protein